MKRLNDLAAWRAGAEGVCLEGASWAIVQARGRPVFADRIDLAAGVERAVFENGNILDESARGEIGIAFDVAILHDDMAEMMAIVADEAIAPGVEGVAELAGAGDRFVFFLVDRIEAEVHAAKIDDRAIRL